MGKRKCSSDSAYIKEHIRQGFGQGRGADYKPWLGVRDVPSTGVSSRVKGWTTSRVHEFFSQNELHYFYLLDWSMVVSDIRSSVPVIAIRRNKRNC
jgi:hypothetical protein